MSKFNKETQKSMRVVLSLETYNALKDKCTDYGDMSRVVRHLLKQWLSNPKSTIRQIYDDDLPTANEGEWVESKGEDDQD